MEFLPSKQAAISTSQGPSPLTAQHEQLGSAATGFFQLVDTVVKALV